MTCPRCEFVTPGMKCPECGTRKPKQAPSRDTGLLIVIILPLGLLLWSAGEGLALLRAILEKPGCIIIEQTEEPLPAVKKPRELSV